MNNHGRKIFSDDELIQMLRDYAKKHGRSPTVHIVNDNPEMPSANVFISRFGTFNEALEIAGLRANRRVKKRSREELIQCLKEYGKKIGRAPTCQMIDADPDMPYSSVYVKYFGGFNNALELAGFQINRKKNRYTDEELIQLLKDFGKKTGKTPTLKMINSDPEMPFSICYYNHFGSFNEALELAGFKVKRRR